MSNVITKEMLLSTAPAVLLNDPEMHPLVELAADQMAKFYAKCSLPNIYSRIDELPEDLLDILAQDFKVEWYDYNWGIEAKRKTIKDSFFVHRHLGTTGAVKRALSDVWPPSTVEEWFEYGGQPYFFRVILEASRSDEPIRVDTALNAIMFYKSARSHLESNIPVVRVTFGFVIKTAQDNMRYHVRSTGTEPRVATHGNRAVAAIDVATDSPSAVYHSPLTGQLSAGTHPSVATHGNTGKGDVTVGAASFESTYTARPCGTSLNSLA